MTEGLKPGWRRWRFEQMATNVNERVDDPSEAGVDFYVGLEHLDSDSLKIRRWGSPEDVSATKLLFEPGDIIFGRRRAYQRKLGVAEWRGIASAHSLVLRAKPEVVLAEFLPFFMQSDLFMDRAQRISVGSLSPTINWKTLAKEEFALPPLEEQRRIVRILAANVSLAERATHLSRKLELLRAAAIKEFSNSIHPGHICTFRQAIVAIEAGKSPPGSPHAARKGEYGVLKVSAVGDWDFNAEENKAIASEQFLESRTVAAGDFLVARANADPDSVGRTCIVDSCPDRLMLSDKTWRIAFSTAYSDLRWGLLAWTKSPRFRQYIRQQLGGTEAKNISQSRLLDAPAPKPNERFRSFDGQIRQVQSAIYLAQTRFESTQRIGRFLLNQVMQ